ncbi:hypothetical protein ACN47E_003461 [Coniothyrium glycines]
MHLPLALALLAPLTLALDPTYANPLPRSPAYLSKRAVSATVLVDGLRYRTCPKTSCAAPGQFAKGTRISLACFTRENTETIKGDKGWAKVASSPGKGNWVAMAFGEYVHWDSSLPAC